MKQKGNNSEQSVFQGLLRKAWAEAQARNPRLSMRSFAKKSGMSAAGMSQVLKGKRTVSGKMAKKVLEKLALTPTEMDAGLSSVLGTSSGSILQYSTFDMNQYHLIADWYHAAILSLVEIPDFRAKPEWIAHRLGITKTQASDALKRLIELELIQQDQNKNWKLTEKRFATSDHVNHLSLRKAHRQNLELAARSLDLHSIDDRDFTAITMAIDPARLPEAKQMIRKARDEICAFLEGGKKSEVYKMCIQLVPLTQLSITEEKQ
jgi:transcriptional regulator with XRE-family HTH domain